MGYFVVIVDWLAFIGELPQSHAAACVDALASIASRIGDPRCEAMDCIFCAFYNIALRGDASIARAIGRHFGRIAATSLDARNDPSYLVMLANVLHPHIPFDNDLFRRMITGDTPAGNTLMTLIIYTLSSSPAYIRAFDEIPIASVVGRMSTSEATDTLSCMKRVLEENTHLLTHGIVENILQAARDVLASREVSYVDKMILSSVLGAGHVDEVGEMINFLLSDFSDIPVTDLIRGAISVRNILARPETFMGGDIVDQLARMVAMIVLVDEECALGLVEIMRMKQPEDPGERSAPIDAIIYSLLPEVCPDIVEEVARILGIHGERM
jgi:hypothetical protein